MTKFPLILGSFLMSASMAYGAEGCLPDEPVDISTLTLPPQVMLSEGQEIHSARIKHECQVTLPSTMTPGEGQSMVIVTTPPAYAGRNDLKDAYFCGEQVVVRDDLPLGDQQTTYIFEQKNNSDPLHKIVVMPHSEEILGLGKAFLENGSSAQCTALFKEHMLEYMQRHVGGILQIIP